ncbi:MAG: kynureninase [Gammaproteobacteria bacterium]
MIDTSIGFARDQDANDPLAIYRQQFHIPPGPDGSESIYLCGNSLGLQPRTVQALIDQELEDWREFGVEGHFRASRPWMPYHEQVATPLASLVGAQAEEVVTMNTLTVNLHLMMVSFYRPTSTRFRLVIEKPAFPSDRYAAESQVRFHGFDPDQALLEISPREGESSIREEDIASCIEEFGESIALVMLPGVQYYSGQLFNIGGITELARSKGCAVGWDLAHAAGNVPLALHDWAPDFAAWCSYKYLNAGPGAVAGCFVHQRHARGFDLPRFAGWWGHDKTTRFQMGPEFVPMPGAEGWQLSNPPILSMTPLIASMSLFEDAGMDRLRKKSESLTGYLESLLLELLTDHVRIFTPTNPSQRGCQLSLSLAQGRERGREVFEAISADGVIADWREPDVIRVAPVPLYNSYQDVWRFVDILRRRLQ